MKTSHYLIATLKEIPTDTEVASHQLLIRAGYIRKLASGIYHWLPMGLRVLQKVELIIRHEMDATGALEVLLPAIQPAELWQESGRWGEYDDGLLLKFKDRHGRDFCFGPTHEEVITELARNELKSYKQLPVNFYQIQTKFRDETRPRFGLLRAREFIMKDAYSFHLDTDCLNQTYQAMYTAYTKILMRLSLDFRAVLADSGSIGGSTTQEFHVLADAGEDVIAFSTQSDYAANIEMAEAMPLNTPQAAPLELTQVTTPNIRTIEQVSAFLKLPRQQSVKTLLVKGAEKPLVALVLRGDHQLNQTKVEKLAEIAAPLMFAEEDEIKAAIGCRPGSIGPVALKLPILVDRSAATLTNFCCGANQNDVHFIHTNWGRDCQPDQIYDLRNVVAGDPSPDGKGTLLFKRGIEVGHIFQLGDKYSKAMHATVLDDNGHAVAMSMGCYGMGVSRLVSATIEQFHDAKGILWPTIIAPFHVIMIPINGHKSKVVRETSEQLYQAFKQQGIEVLLDDRDNIRPGAKFTDAELIGIPHRIVVGDRGLQHGLVEYTKRASGQTVELPVDQVVLELHSIVKRELNNAY